MSFIVFFSIDIVRSDLSKIIELSLLSCLSILNYAILSLKSIFPKIEHIYLYILILKINEISGYRVINLECRFSFIFLEIYVFLKRMCFY
jgi:hypothetical protein